MKLIFKFILVVSFLYSGFTYGQFWKKKKDIEEPNNEAGFTKPDKFHSLFFEGMREYGLENYDKSIKAFDECLKLDPNSTAVHFQLSRVYHQMGASSKAITHGRTGFELDKGNKDLYHNYKDLCLDSRSYSFAILATKEFIATLKSNSEIIKYKNDLADLYEYNREPELAIEVFNQLEEQFGFSNAYALERLRLYKNMNMLDKAIEEVNALLTNNKENADYYYQKGALLMQKGFDNDALKEYETALAINPNHGNSLLESGVLMLKAERKEEGIIRLKKAFSLSSIELNDKIIAYNKMPSTGNEIKLELAKELQAHHEESSSANKVLADAYFAIKNKKEGVVYLAKAKDIEPNNYNYSVELVNTYYELKDYNNLKKYSVQATELYPSHHIFYLYAGIAFTELDDYNNALMMLETGRGYVIGQNSMKYDFKLSLAELFYKMGEYNECEKVYDEILAEQPLHATALNNYAYFLARRGYRLSDAEKYVTKAIEIEGEEASFLDTYGWVLFTDKKYDKSIELFDKALFLDPLSPDILEHKGDALYLLGKKAEALLLWQKAKENGGNSKILLKKIDNATYYEK